MDTRKVGEEAILEAVRESLIAISYALPDNDALNSEVTLGIAPNTEEKVVSAQELDKADMFRSELISISHPQLPTGQNGYA